VCKEQYRAFLLERPRTTTLATVRADEYGRCNAVEGELLVRVTPSRVVAYENVSD